MTPCLTHIASVGARKAGFDRLERAPRVAHKSAVSRAIQADAVVHGASKVTVVAEPRAVAESTRIDAELDEADKKLGDAPQTKREQEPQPHSPHGGDLRWQEKNLL